MPSDPIEAALSVFDDTWHEARARDEDAKQSYHSAMRAAIAAYLQKRTCATCHHWLDVGAGPWRECRKITWQIGITKPPACIDASVKLRDRPQLMTGPDFGCNQWEAAEVERATTNQPEGE